MRGIIFAFSVQERRVLITCSSRARLLGVSGELCFVALDFSLLLCLFRTYLISGCCASVGRNLFRFLLVFLLFCGQFGKHENDACFRNIWPNDPTAVAVIFVICSTIGSWAGLQEKSSQELLRGCS